MVCLGSNKQASKFVLSELQLKSLDDEGYLIVRNVVSSNFIDEVNSYIKKWFESIPHYNNKYTSYSDKVHNIAKGRGVGHNFGNWMLRLHPNIISIWCQLWGCNSDELIVSLDGFRHMESSYKPKKEADGSVKSWTHIDEGIINDKIVNFHNSLIMRRKSILGDNSYQMSIATTDVGSDDGCFLCIPKAHKLFDELVDGRDMFQILSAKTLDDLKTRGYNETRITGVNKGDVIIWNSRTPHRSDAFLVNNGKTSGVVFVCYTHRSNTSKKDMEQRVKAFNDPLSTSSHSPAGNNFKINAPPRRYTSDKSEKEKMDKEMTPSINDVINIDEINFENIKDPSFVQLFHSVCSVKPTFYGKPFPFNHKAPSEAIILNVFKDLYEKKHQ